MYSQYSWRVVKIRPHSSHLFFIPRIYGSQKVLTNPQITKLNHCLQEKPRNSEDYVVQVDNKKKELVPNIFFKEIEYSSKSIKGSEKWREISVDTSKLCHYYLKLSKFRLTSLVVMTSMIGYAMSPAPFNVVSFLSCTIGTGLVSSAANSVNQYLEIPFDAQMSRTRNRVLVQGHLTPLHAIGFASAAGSIGLLILLEGANVLTATLGAVNLALYTIIYTPLKRISILNTWIGSIVGAIPPLMGWAACQGSLDAGAFILGGVLYAWQFPHFNALSWNLRPDYSKAGYRMMAVTNPDLCRKTALRYTFAIAVCSSLASVINVTHWSFCVLSLPINLYFIYLGIKFYNESDSKNSRKLFRFSLLHLPILLGLMLLTKQGLFSSFTQPKVKNNEDVNNPKNEESSKTLLQQINTTKNESFSRSQENLNSLTC